MNARSTGPDWDRRPESYWDLSGAFANIKGAERRALIRREIEEAGIDEVAQIPLLLLQDDLPVALRDFLARLHPSFLGGEFLPGYLPGEVEIARITMESTTCDVISIRAAPTKEGISYRIVDEYGTEFDFPVPPPRWEPLTLREITDLIDQARMSGETIYTQYGLAFCSSYVLYDGAGMDWYECWDFEDVDSEFYPALGCHFYRLAREWAIEKALAEIRDYRATCEESPGGIAFEGGFNPRQTVSWRTVSPGIIRLVPAEPARLSRTDRGRRVAAWVREYRHRFRADKDWGIKRLAWWCVLRKLLAGVDPLAFMARAPAPVRTWLEEVRAQTLPPLGGSSRYGPPKAEFMANMEVWAVTAYSLGEVLRGKKQDWLPITPAPVTAAPPAAQIPAGGT